MMLRPGEGGDFSFGTTLPLGSCLGSWVYAYDVGVSPCYVGTRWGGGEGDRAWRRSLGVVVLKVVKGFSSPAPPPSAQSSAL